MSEQGYTLGDTIIAAGTPSGHSAIGILRLSGPQAWSICAALCPSIPDNPAPQRAYVCQLRLALQASRQEGTDVSPSADNGASLCERCVVLLWQAPHSSSGEDIAELHLHGNPLLMRLAEQAAVQHGARVAAPGEFSYRAFLNGKLDLVQAEALQELISASSIFALRIASSALAGQVSSKLRDWVARLNALLASTEVIHDYAADDLDASLDQASLLTPERIRQALDTLCVEMRQSIELARQTAPLRQGIRVAVCGPPNVGKSTLFNAMLGYERSITSNSPGTTRDYVSEQLQHAGLGFTLVDTAGQRDALDEIEAAGVMRAGEWARLSDVLLWVSAADQPASEAPTSLRGKRCLNVLTRCDLLSEWPAQNLGGTEDSQLIYVSGLTGRGLDQLWKQLIELASVGGELTLDSFNQRQAQQVRQALTALEDGEHALDSAMPLDAVCMDLYSARDALLGIYEQPSRSEIVNLIFSSFCVGK